MQIPAIFDLCMVTPMLYRPIRIMVLIKSDLLSTMIITKFRKVDNDVGEVLIGN